MYPVDDNLKNTLSALLEECLANGKLGMESLYGWYLDSAVLIRETLDEVDQLEPELGEE